MTLVDKNGATYRQSAESNELSIRPRQEGEPYVMTTEIRQQVVFPGRSLLSPLKCRRKRDEWLKAKEGARNEHYISCGWPSLIITYQPPNDTHALYADFATAKRHADRDRGRRMERTSPPNKGRLYLTLILYM